MTDREELKQAIDLASKRVAGAITPLVTGGTDESGAYVGSLTEAVMGMTAGLIRIAEAIYGLADAVRDRDG